MFDALFPVRSAVFIDYDNFRGLQVPIARNIPNWFAWLEDGKFADGRKRKFIRKSAYWHPTNATQEDAFLTLGFATKKCIYLAGNKINQSAVDLHLAIDVVALACAPKPPQEIIILASDSDYFPIVKLLNDKGVRSVIVHSLRDASHKYEGVAEVLITEPDLAEACTYQRRPGFFARFRRKPESELAPMATPAQVADTVANAVFALGAPLTTHALLKVVRDLPGFTRSGPNAYFGFGSINQLARDIVGRHPELKIVRDRRGLRIETRPRPKHAQKV